jgi:hypothetical protein
MCVRVLEGEQSTKTQRVKEAKKKKKNTVHFSLHPASV